MYWGVESWKITAKPTTTRTEGPVIPLSVSCRPRVIPPKDADACYRELGSGVGEQVCLLLTSPAAHRVSDLCGFPLQSRRVNTPGFEPRLFALLEGEYLVGLRGQPRHVGGGGPGAADRRQAILRRPTGDGAALSDVDGYPMIPELA